MSPKTLSKREKQGRGEKTQPKPTDTAAFWASHMSWLRINRESKVSKWRRLISHTKYL